MNYKAIIVFCLAGGLGTAALAEETEKSIYKGNVESRINALSSIQPGLGVVMHEIGYRITALYKAANGGNWGLAQYELKELIEAQEVAEVTRPQQAGMLKGFENSSLVPLEKAITQKDIKQFNLRFTKVVNACNACHTALGHAYIKYRVPAQSNSDFLDYNLKTEPEDTEEKEQK